MFKRAALFLCLLALPSLGRAAFLPGPIQVNNGTGTAVAVGWQVGGGTVPTHEIGTANVNITNPSPLAVAVSTLPTVTIQGSGGLVPQVFVSSLPTTAVTQSGPWGLFNAGVVRSTNSDATQLQESVYIAGSSNTVNLPYANPIGVSMSSVPTHGVTESGAWSLFNAGVVRSTNSDATQLQVSAYIAGSSNTMSVTGSTVNVTNYGSSQAINVALPMDIVCVGTTPYTVRTSTVNASASGYNNVVSTVSSRYIMVIGWDLTVNGAVNFKWQSSSGPATDLTGLYYGAAAGNGVARECQRYCFQSKQGEGLNLNLSGATAVGGTVQYILYP